MGNGHLCALVALRRQDDLGTEGFGAGERLSYFGYADVEDGVAVVSRASADTACGSRRLVARRDERVFGRCGDAFSHGGAGWRVPTEQLRVEVAKPRRVGTDQLEVNNWIAHVASVAREER